MQEKICHDVLASLETTLTDPLVLEIATVFWLGHNLVLDPECPKSLKLMHRNLKEI